MRNQRNGERFVAPLVLVFLALLRSGVSAAPQEKAAAPSPKAEFPGSIQLLPGYSNHPSFGMNSYPGKITGKNGFVIEYDIGEMATKPELGQVRWTRKQTIGKQKFQITYTQDRRILLAENGAYFWAETRSEEDLADFLLMALSYRSR